MRGRQAAKEGRERGQSKEKKRERGKPRERETNQIPIPGIESPQAP